MGHFSRSGIADGVGGRNCVILLSVLFILLYSFTAGAAGGSPLIVVENAGQFGDGARYQVAGRCVTLWIADDALWITAMEEKKSSGEDSGGQAKGRAGSGEADGPKKGVALKLTFPGGNDSPKIEPFGRLETKISYFRGGDPEKWTADVPVWSGVRYVDLYPGVDLEIAGEDGVLAPRFVVRDRERASAAKFSEKAFLRIEGAEGLDCDSEAIRCATGIGDVSVPLFGLEYPRGENAAKGALESVVNLSGPVVSGDAILRPFAASSSDGRAADDRAGRDDMRYGTFLGGNGYDSGAGIAVDASGNAYVTGDTESANFPVTAGAFQTALGGIRDVFVVKLNAGGWGLIYGTYLGGDDYDSSAGIAVDASGNAYVTGHTHSTAFPVTAGAFQTIRGGAADAFVAKLNASGSSLIYGTFLGASDYDYGKEIAVDTSGNAYVTGYTNSAAFPVTAGAFQTLKGGFFDAFAVKLNATGSSLIYGTYLGGSDDDYGNGIAPDASGNAYVTGYTFSAAFPVTAGAFRTTSGGLVVAFAVKLNATGSGLIYGTYLGGSEDDRGYGIAADASGNAYVTGYTDSANLPVTAGAFQTVFGGGGRDGFVAKLNATGSGLIYGTFLGGSDVDWGAGIAVDASGNAYVTGRTESANFSVTAGAFQTVFGGIADAFVVKLNATGWGLIYGTYLGGSEDDRGSGIAADASGNAYVTGETESDSFPTTITGFRIIYGGAVDAFVTKILTPPDTGNGGGGCAAGLVPAIAVLLAFPMLLLLRR